MSTPDPEHSKRGARGNGSKQKHLRIRCKDEDGCGWKGVRASPRNRKTKGQILAKPCPKCGGPVYRPEKKRMYQIAAQKRLLASIPEEDRVAMSSTRAIKTDLNAAVIAETCELIEKGNFPSTAAQAAGIPRECFNDWMLKGRRGWAKQEDTIFSRFYLQIEQSKALAEASLVNLGLGKVENNQSTWMGAYRHLESFSRDNWLKPQEINVNAHTKIEHSIDVPPEPPQSHAEWLARKREREIEAEYEVQDG